MAETLGEENTKMNGKIQFEARCRRCSETVVVSTTIADNGPTYLDYAVHGGSSINAPASGVAPKLSGVHNCEDGGAGIADLIGYSPVVEKRAAPRQVGAQTSTPPRSPAGPGSPPTTRPTVQRAATNQTGEENKAAGTGASTEPPK